jgi:hypothetical protein
MGRCLLKKDGGRQAAIDLVLSQLGANTGAVETTPDWVRNEFEIFLVKVSLGGACAAGAVTGLTDKFLGLAEASQLAEACLVIEESPKLQKAVERIVLTWMSELAAGKPLDSRVHALIAEWCLRRIEPTGRGRPQDSPIKKLAVVTRLIEVAAKYQDSAYGAKKQMYGDLKTKFGLGRSQSIKLIGGFNPWAFIKKKASGKSE